MVRTAVPNEDVADAGLFESFICKSVHACNVRFAMELNALTMACKACGSINEQKLNGEINLHFPGIEGLDKPTVWVFPQVIVCLDCGYAQFSVQQPELKRIAELAGS
jgi:hypothetical protein